MKRRDGVEGRVDNDAESELAARAAWLYHVGGLLQAEVAKELHLSLFKVNRLIAFASERGIVRIMVDGPIADCVMIERRLAERFDLRSVRVVPDLGDRRMPLHALGVAAASFLHGEIENKRHRIIGVGHGRTLAAASQYLPARKASHVQFVALLGSLPSRLSAHPFEVVYTLTDRTGSSAHLITVPLYADDPADRAVLLRQSGVRRAFEAADQASLCLLGIGSVADKEGTDLRMEAFTPEDLAEVRHAGAVGELLGYYYDAEGKKVKAALHDRVIALDPEKLRGRDAIAVAGGEPKIDAILAILRTGILSGLITTDGTARKLLAKR